MFSKGLRKNHENIGSRIRLRNMRHVTLGPRGIWTLQCIEEYYIHISLLSVINHNRAAKIKITPYNCIRKVRSSNTGQVTVSLAEHFDCFPVPADKCQNIIINESYSYKRYLLTIHNHLSISLDSIQLLLLIQNRYTA
jgi:hypothetical protein